MGWGRHAWYMGWMWMLDRLAREVAKRSAEPSR